MLQHLPLKEDFEEYELVFKAFLTLFSAGHKLTLACLPKMLECAAIFTAAHGIDKSRVGLLKVFPNVSHTQQSGHGFVRLPAGLPTAGLPEQRASLPLVLQLLASLAELEAAVAVMPS